MSLLSEFRAVDLTKLITPDILNALASEIPAKDLDELIRCLKIDQEFEKIRKNLISKFAELKNEAESTAFKSYGLLEKSRLLMLLEKVMDEFQIVEKACNTNVVDITRIIFQACPARCIDKPPEEIDKPIKKKKTESNSNRDARRCDRESPMVRLNQSVERKKELNEMTFKKIGKRRSNREKSAVLISTLVRRPKEKSVLINNDIKNNNINFNENNVDKSEKKENECLATAICNLPRRRGAAVSVTETVYAQRSVSPRKRNVAGTSSSSSNVMDDDGDSGALQDEQTYCLCNQVSFGDMIMCDNSRCPYQWFHFSCVNVKSSNTKKKWFCPLCRGVKETVLKPSLQTKK